MEEQEFSELDSGNRSELGRGISEDEDRVEVMFVGAYSREIVNNKRKDTKAVAAEGGG